MQIDRKTTILWILLDVLFDFSEGLTSPCIYPVPTASFQMRQQCSAYFNLDILCDIDGMISGVTAERLQVAYENNACFKSGQIGFGIMVVKNMPVPKAKDVESEDLLADDMEAIYDEHSFATTFIAQGLHVNRKMFGTQDSAKWSCLDQTKKISLQRHLPWRNSTSMYTYMDLFADAIMNRWFVKDRECKKPYFLFLIVAKEALSVTDSSPNDKLSYPMIRIAADHVFIKDFGQDFLTYLKEYIFYNDMSTPSRTVPIVMDKICRKFDETDEILRSRQSVPQWAVALFIFCSLASLLCLLIDVVLIRKKAFGSLMKSDGQRGRSSDVGQKRSDNLQVHLLF